MFIYKKTEELEKMSATELDQYKTELKAHEAEELKGNITKEVEAQIKEANKDLDNVIGAEIAKQLAEQGTKDNASKEVSFYEALKSAISENKDALVALKDRTNGNVQLTVNKAVVNMTFATNSTGRVGRQEFDTNSVGPQRKPRFISQIISMSPTTARTFSFVDRTGHEGAPAMTAEGVLKPVGDWNMVETTVNPKKVAFIVTISKEMLDDIDNMAADIMTEIEEQILDVMETQWLNGDGTGDNISGILDNATPFAAGPLALSVNLANKKDCLRAAIDQVRRNNFLPNYIVVSTSDSALMDMEKDSTGQYLFPTFVGSDGMTVKGIPVIESNYVAAGNFFVGDFTRYKGKVREGLTIDTGYKDGDWQKNFVSFRGEARFFGYIPTNHFGAIVYGNFTTAAAALETA